MLNDKEIDALPDTDWRRSDVFRARMQAAAEPRERIQDLADQRDELRHTTGIGFVLGHDAVSTCIVGLANDRDITANAPAGNPPYLDGDEIKAVRVGRTS